jgi:hypothetical protein
MSISAGQHYHAWCRTLAPCFVRLSVIGAMALIIVAVGLPCAGATSSASAADPTPITTSALKTSPSAELVSSVPIYKEWDSSVEKVVYSLPIPSVRAGETLRATGNVELTGSHSYAISASARMVIGSNPSNAEGAVVTPRANTTFTAQMSRLTLPIDGLYNATADLGTQYLKLVLKAPAWEAQEGDSLSVVADSGHLAVTRYAPTTGPTAVVTHELQSCITASEQITSIPVDSQWRSVLSCDMGEVSTEDRLEPFGQLEVGNLNTANVKLESMVLAATTATGAAAGPDGLIISPNTVDLLTANNRFARIVQSSGKPTNSASKHYVNLLVRAVPAGEGSLSPLTVNAGSAVLNVLRFKRNPGDPANPLLPGTFEQTDLDPFIDAPSIPFAAEGKKPVVVNSLPIHGLRKGEVIRPQGMLTADLNGGESAPVETELILADSKTATIGEVVSGRRGDTIPTSQQIHTIVKNGTYVGSKASFATRFLNLVAYANREPVEPGEALKVSRASISFSRSKPTKPFSADFEDGSLDQFFKYGQTNTVTENQAREGTRSMQVDIDSNSICTFCGGGQPDPEGIRRAEIVPPDRESSGGFAGVDRWYGWSVYFPESFKAPPVEHSYFTGRIDEVRIYDEALSQSQIEADKEGQYGSGAAPVATFLFNENEGQIAYDSAGDHHGEIVGAQWTSSGKYGSALQFNGLNSLVSVPDAAELDLTDSFTLEAWVNPDKLRWWNPIIGKSDGLEEEASGYLLNAGFHEYPAGLVYDSGTKKEVPDFSAKLPNKAWSHLAITSDGSSLRIYVNGVLKETRVAMKAGATEGPLTIGTNDFNPGINRGQWNAFTQWHDSTDGIECNTDTSIPIGLSATRYRKGFRYSEAEAATPVEGDYIDIGLNGGEIEEIEDGVCHSLTPTQRHILAPLQRGQWYDFIVHTRWTTEEGEPGNSVTSVWINGKQVLGDETIPVSKPTLYWKGTPATHNSIMTWQFGLYRGPTADDANSRLFVDSAKVGESYADVAPEAHAPRLDAESYPADLAGGGLGTFSSSSTAIECSDTALMGTISEAASELLLSAEHDECSAGEAAEFAASVDMNSCHYVLSVENVGPPYTGALGVACDSEGDAIEFSSYEGAALVCTAKVTPQESDGGVGLSNVGEGLERGVRLNDVAEGIEYEVEGPGCGEGPTVRSDGELRGETTLLGLSGEGEEQVGIHLTGHELHPRLEAENYAAALNGTGSPDLMTNLGTFECGSASLEGIVPNATSQLSLHPEYGECGIDSGGTHFVASVKTNGCHYTIGVREDAASPYEGTWGVTCKEPGEAIEFKITKNAYNCLRLRPQEGREGIEFSQSGEGPGREVDLNAEVAGVEYEWVGVCGSEARSDGVISGETTLSAEDEGGAPIGLWLAGEP